MHTQEKSKHVFIEFLFLILHCEINIDEFRVLILFKSPRVYHSLTW